MASGSLILAAAPGGSCRQREEVDEKGERVDPMDRYSSTEGVTLKRGAARSVVCVF